MDDTSEQLLDRINALESKLEESERKSREVTSELNMYRNGGRSQSDLQETLVDFEERLEAAHRNRAKMRRQMASKTESAEALTAALTAALISIASSRPDKEGVYNALLASGIPEDEARGIAYDDSLTSGGE